MLQVLARQISHNFLPEAQVMDTTFQIAEGCATRSAEDEKTLGFSLSVRIKEDMARGKKRVEKKCDYGDDEDDENEDEDDDS